ncbi:MAG: cation:proton antiporter [Anaerolineales bacterium]|nr:cation:proton antiporter [Anaerolineales bacterium]
MINAIVAVLVAAMILGFIRLYRGPHQADRVVALDFITTLGISLITAYAILTDQVVFLDVAIVLALISFLGTIAFAFYLERRTHDAHN